MANERRERQRANRQQKMNQQQQEERRDQLRRYGFLAAIVALVVVAGLVLLSMVGGDDDTADDEDSTDETAASEAAEAGEAEGTPDTADGAADADAEDTGTEVAAEPLPCPAEDGSSEQVLEFPAPPPDCLAEGASYTAVLDTSAGEMVVELDAEGAPLSVNNFVYLARYHYYDGVLFHRVIEDFMIQGGDPTGDPPGTGGPGYTIDEEPPEPGGYQVGSLAMAKRTPPSTTGAQFFIVTGDAGVALPNEYSLFGQVTEGVEVADAIQAVETDGFDKPVADVVINSITVVQS